MRYVKLVSGLLFLIILLCGCTPSQNTDGRYSAEFPYDAQQYMMFLNKEIQAPVNHLSAAISALTKYKTGEFTDDGLLELLNSGHTIVSEASQAIYAMRPAKEYADTAKEILDVLETVKYLYSECIREMKKEEPDTGVLEDIKNRMYESYLRLTAEGNTYWR